MKTSILAFIFILTLTFTSCQNFEGTNASSNTDDLVLKSAEIAVNDMITESVIEEANYDAGFFAESEQLLRQLAHLKGSKNLLDGKKGLRYITGQYPNVSIDTTETTYPVIITIDYGDETELNNGRIIRGTVIVEISAEKGTDGATRNISYVDCVIDSVGINGTCSQVFNGDNKTTRKMTTSSDVTFVLADGTVIDRVGNHVREWLEGLDTPMEHDDDVIEITGSLEATSSTGESWSRIIIEPLLRQADCRYNVQGIVQFSNSGEVVAELNFGDGECDNLANLTSDGETIEIELQGRKPKANMEKHNSNKKNNKNG